MTVLSRALLLTSVHACRALMFASGSRGSLCRASDPAVSLWLAAQTTAELRFGASANEAQLEANKIEVAAKSAVVVEVRPSQTLSHSCLCSLPRSVCCGLRFRLGVALPLRVICCASALRRNCGSSWDAAPINRGRCTG